MGKQDAAGVFYKPGSPSLSRGGLLLSAARQGYHPARLIQPGFFTGKVREISGKIGLCRDSKEGTDMAEMSREGLFSSKYQGVDKIWSGPSIAVAMESSSLDFKNFEPDQIHRLFVRTLGIFREFRAPGPKPVTPGSGRTVVIFILSRQTRSTSARSNIRSPRVHARVRCRSASRRRRAARRSRSAAS